MWSIQAAGETASDCRSPDHRSDDPGVNRDIKGCAVPYKHGPAHCRRSALVKIVSDSLPSDRRQRQGVDTVGLASANGQRARLPVDVVQVQRRYFAGAKPEINQAANDRVIAPTLRIIPVEG